MALLPHSYFRFLTLNSEHAWRLLEQTLCESRLPTSAISNFNDPFESGPIIFGDRSKRVSIDGTYRAATIWSPLARPAWEKLFGKSLLIDELIQFYTSFFSVVSFSRRINSGLLWSHYTNGYRGIALHFTPSAHSKSVFKDSHFQWVSYEKQRPIISLDRLRNYFDHSDLRQADAHTLEAVSVLELQFIQALLFWKSEDWSYEQEARLVVGSDQPSIAFPSSELASVVIGPRCPREDVERIYALAARREDGINIAHAKLSRTDYSVEIDW